MKRFLRALTAGVAASGTLIAIGVLGNGVAVGVSAAPAAAGVAFLAAWVVQRWRLGGVFVQQLTVIASTIVLLALLAALIMNKGAVGPFDVLAGIGLAAIGAFAFWPAVLGGVVTYVVTDCLIARRL